MVSRDLFLHCAENTVSNCMHTIHFTSSNRATFKSFKKMTKKKTKENDSQNNGNNKQTVETNK